jgi:hypothetical protein
MSLPSSSSPSINRAGQSDGILSRFRSRLETAETFPMTFVATLNTIVHSEAIPCTVRAAGTAYLAGRKPRRSRASGAKR